jgi:hypothetical protein
MQTRVPYDAVFVEAHTVGQDDWTTLPDSNGHTRPDSALSCSSNQWFSLFPQLVHYMKVEGEGRQAVCIPEGTTGTWNAATGSTGGEYQGWSIDLSPFAGREVEVSITYLSSRLPYWGILIDDVSLSTGESTSFETDMGGWSVIGAPPGHDPNAVDYTRVAVGDIPVSDAAAIVVREDTILVGFGLEQIAPVELRNEFIRRAMDYLLPDSPPTPTHMIYLPMLWRQ